MKTWSVWSGTQSGITISIVRQSSTLSKVTLGRWLVLLAASVSLSP